MEEEKRKKPLLSDLEVSVFRRELKEMLQESGLHTAEGAAHGQPFHLDLLRAALVLMGDVDIKLVDFLEEGVPTGVFAKIAPSGVWRQREPCEAPVEPDWAGVTRPARTAAAYFTDLLPNRLLNRSIRPAVSIIFCLPV